MENRNYDLRVNASYEIPQLRPSGDKKAPTRMKALLMYLIVAAGLLLSSLLVSGVQMLFPDMSFWFLQLITSVVYYLGAFALPVFLFVRKGGRPAFNALRPNPVSFRTAAIAAALALVGVYFANNLTVLWSLPFDALDFNIYANAVPEPKTIPDLVLAVFTVGIMPGLFEEAVFRGFMQPAFEESGTKRAVIFVSMLFALLHGSVVGLPAQFVLGVLMAILLVLTDSIYPGIIFHTVYNSATMILLYVQTQAGVASPVAGEMFEFLGAGGLVLALFQLPMQGAAIFFILRGLYCRAKNSGFRAIPKQPMRMRGGEIALLCVSLGFAVLYYLLDILAMTGVLM
jgi:membrane protease YdiL (CAAX protease family)